MTTPTVEAFLSHDANMQALQRVFQSALDCIIPLALPEAADASTVAALLGSQLVEMARAAKQVPSKKKDSNVQNRASFSLGILKHG